MTNGGFETGDFTGWICTDGTVTGSNPHSGSWCAQVYPSGSRLLKQILATPIAVDDMSAFTFWFKDSDSCAFKIIYSDATDTGWLDITDQASWTERDVLSELTSGKTVTEIHILNGYSQPLHIDDASLIYIDSAGTGNVTIGNNGGTLYCKAIYWRETQVCEVAVRDVPTRTAGAFVDTGTYVLKNRRLKMTIRCATADKTMLQAIFDQNENCTVSVTCESGSAYPRWVYTCWFRNKRIEWRYRKESGTEKCWFTDLEFICTTHAYETS